MKLVGPDGCTPQEHVHDILAEIKRKLDNSGKVMQNAVLQTIRRHFQTIYPGSKHYAPEKVQNGQVQSKASGPEATVAVDVPGVSRAYHNLVIKPKNAKHLTIPMHRSAYGISPRDAGDLVYVKTKKGTELLAKVDGGSLVFMYLLKDQVRQRRDSRLMPSDGTLAENIKARIWAYLQK